MKTKLFILVMAAAAAHLFHLQLDSVPLPQSDRLEETLPSPEAARLMSLGYKSLVADYYWLSSLSHFGTTEMHEHLYPNLVPLLELTLELDPYFGQAYFFAGTSLTIRGFDPQLSIRILERGMQYRPDDWRVPYLLGFNAYYFGGDYKKGALYLAKAAENPKAPPVTGPLAARLAVEAGDPRLGLRLIDELLNTVKDEKLLEIYRDRRSLLMLELRLDFLEQAADRYQAQTGERPRRIEDLVRPGLMRGIPEEPAGGKFFIDEEGRVATTSEEKRLRLHKSE